MFGSILYSVELIPTNYIFWDFLPHLPQRHVALVHWIVEVKATIATLGSWAFSCNIVRYFSLHSFAIHRSYRAWMHFQTLLWKVKLCGSWWCKLGPSMSIQRGWVYVQVGLAELIEHPLLMHKVWGFEPRSIWKYRFFTQMPRGIDRRTIDLGCTRGSRLG